MSDVFCPFCSTSQSLPHATAGQTARCKSCGKTFMVPAFPSPRASASPNRPASATPVASGSPQAAPWQHSPVPTGGAGAAASRTAEPEEPTAAQTAGGNSIGLILLGGTVCFLAGCLLLLVVVLKLAQGGREPDRPTAANVRTHSSAQIVRWTPESSRSSGWSSVARGVAIDLNSLAVDVHYVGFGEVRARDARNRVVVSDQRNYLQVYLRIKNLGAETVQYASWQGNSFAADGQQVRATLVDDQGHSYPMQQFTHVAGLQGHTPRAILANNEEVGDVVVFTLPPSVDSQAIRHFRLELPAEAYGGSGVYRFEFPPQSIQGFP